VDALLAVSGSDWDTGRRLAHEAAADRPGALLPAALATFLDAGRGPNIYAEPEGFDRFIGGGANPALYRETISALTGLTAAHAPASILDIGCGDGRVTVATAAACGSAEVTLVEPSATLLETAVSAFAGTGREVDGHNTSVEDFLVQAAPGQRWALVQSTFAMHTLAPSLRSTVLHQLSSRTRRLVLVEFDVPAFEDHSAEHAAYAAERYEAGLAEYPGDQLVAQRFLMPVLVGQFDPAQTRHTFEQSADLWTDDLRTAGFDAVSVTPVFDYWWAPAVLIDATS
jgi:SAM-dependent methyltransferase